MRQLRARWLPILIAVLVIGGPVAWYKWPATASAADAVLTTPVKKGTFKVIVTTTGELRARKFVQIQGPNSQPAQIYQSKITWIVPEGTVVKEGDKIAELDRAPAATRQQSVTLDLQKAEAQFTDVSLDSALNLSQAREDVKTAEYGLEEKEARQGAGAVRGAVHQAAGGDRLREGAARPRSVEEEPRHEDEAGRGEDVGRGRRPGSPAEQPQDGAGRAERVHDQRAVARHGDLRSRMERKEKGRRLAVEHVGSDRGDAARPHADGVADVRERGRRAEAARRSAGVASRSTPIRRRSSPAR